MELTVDQCIRLDLVHEVHTSERRSFRACRRRWSWHFRDAYYPLVTPKPLEFGEAYHRAMEVIYNPDTWGMDREAIARNAIHSFELIAEEQKKRALEHRGESYLDHDIEDDYNERLELGRGMISYYATQVAPVLDIGWKPVRVEIGFKVPVKDPEKGYTIVCYCQQCKAKFDEWYNSQPASKMGENPFWPGLPVVYAGRCDMLAEDLDTGGLWIFDWKTARSIPDNHEFLFLDDQVSSYVWALNKLGLNVRGFVYHEQRKGFPRPPKENKYRRLGRLFSVSETQETDYETYLAHIKEYDTEAYENGLYDDFLTFLKNEGVVYYHREKIYKSLEELEEVERNIGNEILDMIDPGLRIYPSPGRFGCSFCAFQQPCREKNAKGDYQYALDTMFEQRAHYYVRQQASTESKGAE